MVATPDEVLPLALAKTELRIPEIEESHDAMLVRQRDAAVRYVETCSGRHAVDTRIEFWRQFPFSLCDPVDFGFLPDAKLSGHTLEYYTQEKRIMTDGSPFIGVSERYAPNYFRLRPADQWPDDAYRGRDARWMLNAGMEVVDAAFTQAATLLLRALYNGLPMHSEHAAVDRLLAPFCVPR